MVLVLNLKTIFKKIWKRPCDTLGGSISIPKYSMLPHSSSMLALPLKQKSVMPICMYCYIAAVCCSVALCRSPVVRYCRMGIGATANISDWNIERELVPMKCVLFLVGFGELVVVEFVVWGGRFESGADRKCSFFKRPYMQRSWHSVGN